MEYELLKTIQENRKQFLSLKNFNPADQLEALEDWLTTHFQRQWLGPEKLQGFEFLNHWLHESTLRLQKFRQKENFNLVGHNSYLIWAQDPIEVLWLLDLLPQLWITGSYTFVLVSQNQTVSVLTHLKKHLQTPTQLDVSKVTPERLQFLSPLPIWGFKLAFTTPGSIKHMNPQTLGFQIHWQWGKSFGLWMDDQFQESNLKALWHNLHQGYGLGFWSCQRLLIPQPLFSDFLKIWQQWLNSNPLPLCITWPEAVKEPSPFWSLVTELPTTHWQQEKGILWAWNASLCHPSHQLRWNGPYFVIQEIRYPFEAIKWIKSQNHTVFGLWIFSQSPNLPPLKPPVIAYLPGNQLHVLWQWPLSYPWPQIVWKPISQQLHT